MTLANRITLSRMMMSLVMFVMILTQTVWSVAIAFSLLTIAAISDYIDGAIARKTKTTTSFGAIADPFADKILIMAAFIAFASVKELNVPLWAVFIILLRELCISTLRVLAALQGEVMKAERSGKLKTLTQIISVFVIMLLLFFQILFKGNYPQIPFFTPILVNLSQIVYWITVFVAVITFISGVLYLSNNMRLLKKSWGEKGS
ncbi:MAG: CDP-diacylglycerol--glycerol-3-phosphate 3-phosphatidyltransferase [Elusimicrobiales bacterium]|nr:CDP-diacylglycerol--glycerol-3-phosphate 3-phosphatidyltransferase [Elusimicrobiales bacterium]MCK5106686.1 CDP-diacylglycerol--glycerol-3-phosphate 3-phosphatidyltransferase [Elusimicrobiales bacterium]